MAIAGPDDGVGAAGGRAAGHGVGATNEAGPAGNLWLRREGVHSRLWMLWLQIREQSLRLDHRLDGRLS